jgi:hypothetical protein
MSMRRRIVVAAAGLTILLSLVVGTTLSTTAADDASRPMPEPFASPIVAGTVFLDIDADGHREAGEPGIRGAVVSVLQDGNLIASTTTGAQGRYGLALGRLGDYVVRETNPPGYSSTTPDEVAVSLTEAEPTEFVDFGDLFRTYLALVVRNAP